MFYSIALILLSGLFLSWLCRKMHLPPLLGMLLTGVLLGPHVLNQIGSPILSISADLRKMALVIILTRAGLGLDPSPLKRLGRPALLMCFLPATFELAGMLLAGPRLLGLSLTESAVCGAVLAAVSPAVVVPRMVRLMDEGYGTAEGIPQMILAGASVDDVYVIVLFSTFTGMLQGESASMLRFVNIPVSILLGAAVGLLCGGALSVLFTRFHFRDTVKVLILLSIFLLLIAAEDRLTTPLTFSSLIAVMCCGIALRRQRPDLAQRLSGKYSRLWVAAEIFLFVLVGAAVNISSLGRAGLRLPAAILFALLLRMLGVAVCLTATRLDRKERLFTMLAYTPKATVQAAIGGIPLSLGLACGDTVLTAAVLAIVITAPLGAFAIDLSYKRLLKREAGKSGEKP